MRRIFFRLAMLAIPLSLLTIVFVTVRVVRRATQQTAQWLQSVQGVNRIGWDGADAERDRSGVPEHLKRTVVMAKTRGEYTDWVSEELPGWESAIYSVDDNHALHWTAKNKGREANAYLTFLIERYDNLPDFMVFMHAHRDSWHVDNELYLNPASVHNLRLDFVERNGYANLRCMHDPGCPEGVRPFRSPRDPKRTHEHVFAAAWAELMGSEVAVPELIGVPCCSQFAVSKAQVLQRAKADYKRYHHWLMNTPLDDDLSGRVMEYMWHVIFGQDPVYCPDLYQCYCDVYGACQGHSPRPAP